MDMTAPPPALALPASQAEIDLIQSERKRFLFERCRESRFHAKRLAGIDAAKLDDPAEWAKIPILDKDELRSIPADRFFELFCMAPREDICELWRSGGSTGVPLFYPRTFLDMRYGLLSFGRAFELAGVGRGDTAHISFPLGIHPVGHVYARVAQAMGVGVNWAGSGAGTPSALQVDLIKRLQPTLWMGMSSYGLHLANLAEAQGVDLTSCGVKRLMTSAEPLSDAKRAKLERMWGAKVFDTFGMTEAGLMGCESDAHDGFHIWTDMYLIEVVEPDTKRPVPEGEVGSLIVTPLWTSHATPFIRWMAGDLVTYRRRGAAGGAFGIFPVIKHAHRTTGFFKVRGVNINHSEFEDFMFRFAAVSDFKAEVVTIRDLDTLRLSFEVKRDADAKATADEVAAAVKRTFEVSPEIVVLERGSLAREFEGAVKAPRFQDRRA
jgi:phenylacetate-CoA ligase